MPDVTWNGATWDGSYDWSQGGEEWSGPWGNSEAQWFGAIYPRVHRFLPAKSVLEIAPGYGRWTRFLVNVAEQFVGVDLSGACVAACKKAFASFPHASFLQNDGTDLSMVPDGSVDFVFSFDSLVHVEMDVIEAYVDGIVRKLRRGGTAFLHHSNSKDITGGDAQHHRATSVSRQLVAQRVAAAGGKVLLQEAISWGGDLCVDCISVFGREADFPQAQAVFIENPQFMHEANLIRQHLAPYAALSSSGLSSSGLGSS